MSHDAELLVYQIDYLAYQMGQSCETIREDVKEIDDEWNETYVMVATLERIIRKAKEGIELVRKLSDEMEDTSDE